MAQASCSTVCSPSGFSCTDTDTAAAEIQVPAASSETEEIDRPPCLHRERDVEQGRLGPRPADELEPDGEPALVVPDLDGDGRQAQEVPCDGVADQRGCLMIQV